MCAFFGIHNYSLKWITYLVVVIGVYTLVHWFIATPLTYSHFFECCNEKWHSNWVAWLLAVSFALWFIVCSLILLLWCCLRRCVGKRMNESSFHLTEVKNWNTKTPDEMRKSFEGISRDRFNSTEILSLPKFDSKGDFTILQINESQRIRVQPRPESTISIDEKKQFVKKGDRSSSEEEKKEVIKRPKTPLKTPREIFFQDLIEAAAKSPNKNSYFDFDPEKIAETLSKKYDLEKEKSKEEEMKKEIGEDEKEIENEDDDDDQGEETEKEEEDVFDDTKSKEAHTFFVGSHKERENSTSEVYIALDENGSIIDEPVVFGQFKVLK